MNAIDANNVGQKMSINAIISDYESETPHLNFMINFL